MCTSLLSITCRQRSGREKDPAFVKILRLLAKEVEEVHFEVVLIVEVFLAQMIRKRTEHSAKHRVVNLGSSSISCFKTSISTSSGLPVWGKSSSSKLPFLKPMEPMLRCTDGERILAHCSAYVACCFRCFATQTKFTKQKYSELPMRYLRF
jgi:hypothetical protein